MANYLNPALANNLVEMAITDKPNNRLQKYHLTKKGVIVNNANEIQQKRPYQQFISRIWQASRLCSTIP